MFERAFKPSARLPSKRPDRVVRPVQRRAGNANGDVFPNLSSIDLTRVPASGDADGRAPSPYHPYSTALPHPLKMGLEKLSGAALDDVRVHYRSPHPARLFARAFAQGRDIHLAPGEERHLPHEGWHVVQQKRGRVKPTIKAASGVPINDDARFEREADMMGARASQLSQSASVEPSIDPVAQRTTSRTDTSAPPASIRASAPASTTTSPVQMIGKNWWGAIGGAALGVAATAATGGLAVIPALAAAAGGALLGRQAAIESGNITSAVRSLFGGKKKDAGPLAGLSEHQLRPTEPGTLEGFLPGASRHKQVTDQVFKNLRSKDNPASIKNGSRLNDRSAALGREIRGKELDAKLKNDVFVAHIMADHGMMKEAAEFTHDMAGLYGPGGRRTDVIRGRALEMTHLWPDQDLSADRNSKYRGWTPVVTGLPRLLAGKMPALTGAALGVAATAATGGLAAIPTLAGALALGGGAAAGKLLGYAFGGNSNKLASGLEANQQTLGALKDKQTRYTPEETYYILRAMGQLRDVMKPEKGSVHLEGGPSQPGLIRKAVGGGAAAGAGFPKAPEVKPTGRIRVTGESSTGLGRNTPSWHSWSRGLNRKIVPLAASYYHGTPPYEIQHVPRDVRRGRAKPTAPGSFDFLMGTSGTTLDMLNFFMAQGKTADQAARLMQVFYANWHQVAPDGNAHSQSESIGTMTQYLYGHNLKQPLMVPIRNEADVANNAEHLFSPLTKDDKGYLVGGRLASTVKRV